MESGRRGETEVRSCVEEEENESQLVVDKDRDGGSEQSGSVELESQSVRNNSGFGEIDNDEEDDVDVVGKDDDVSSFIRPVVMRGIRILLSLPMGCFLGLS